MKYHQKYGRQENLRWKNSDNFETLNNFEWLRLIHFNFGNLRLEIISQQQKKKKKKKKR